MKEPPPTPGPKGPSAPDSDASGDALTELFEQAADQSEPPPPAGSDAAATTPTEHDTADATTTTPTTGSDATAPIPIAGEPPPARSGEPTPLPAPAIEERPAGRHRLRRVLKIALVVVLLPLVLLLVVVGAWAADGLLTADEVSRGVSVRGRSVGGLSEEDLRAVLAGLDREMGGRAVVIETPTGRLETTASQLGASIDIDATAESVLDVGQVEPLANRPGDWLAALVQDRAAPVTYRVNRTLAAHTLAELVAANTIAPIEPTITATDAGWEVVPGVGGEVLDAGPVVEHLADRLPTGSETIEIAATPVETDPRFTDEEAGDLAAEAERLTGAPLGVAVEGQTVDADPTVLRGFYTPVVGEDALELEPRPEVVDEWLGTAFAGLHVDPVDARFEMGLGPTVVPSQDGRTCCDEESTELVFEALDEELGTVDLEVVVLEPAFTTEAANALGVIEPVASFTTEHACCQSRVNNIHRIADLTRGALILPDESLSVNGYVGERTREKGFEEAGAIYAGVFVEDVGGGVSQYATTLFNAAFFAGLDFDEYQAHSIYISRYPYGREATISYPAPDLAVHNPSPYGVLVWPTYTDTSITVTLWSTKWVEADQTDQRERGLAGGCTEVVTERTRRFLSAEEAERIRGVPVDALPDPGEGEEPRDPMAVVDSVFAVYQPAEGVLC